MTPSRSTTAADKYWLFALAFGLPLLAMLLLGQDSSWDLRNYHLYNPHAWLTGRMAQDIAPAQLQTWHNPLLDVPLYLLITSGWSPRWASAWLTLPYIASLYFLLRIQGLLTPAPPSRLSQSVLALLALTGAASYSTLATSTNDGFVAAAMLGSLVLVLSPEQQEKAGRRWLLAGLVAGAMAGLKLTASFYCIALACAALPGGDWRKKAGRVGSLALGGALGFGLTYGYWGWQLYAAHGNPFFPYFNNIFHSPDALALSYVDARFRPTTIFDGLLSPIHLLQKSQRFSELKLKDPRLLLGLLAFSTLYALFRRRLPEGSLLQERIRLMLVFFVASFLLWIGQYGIYRYAMALETLGCVGLVVSLHWLPRWKQAALLASLLLVSVDTKRPHWGRDAGNAPVAGLKMPAIANDSLVVIASDEPLAYLALGLPSSVPLVAVFNNLMSPERCTQLQMRAQQTIARHRGPIWLLHSDEVASERGQSLITRHYGLQAAGACIPFSNSLAGARLCPQRRTAVATVCPTP